MNVGSMNPRAPQPTLAERTTRGAAWLSAQAMLVKATTLLTQLALARYLLEDEFGLYARAMTVYTFAGLLHQAGIQEILIKRQKSFDVWVNCAFWLSLATGTGTCLLTLAIAPLAAAVYNTSQPETLQALIMLLAFVFPITAAGGVCRAKMQIEMRFRDLAMIGTLVALLDLALKVGFAAAGYRAYSFIYTTLLTSLVQLAGCWILAPVPVRWNPQFRRWRYLWGDSLMIIGTLFLYWMIEEGDYVVLGCFEGDAVVGFYFYAYKISRHTMSLLTFQFAKVLLPALSKLPARSPQQSEAFIRAARLLVVFSVPLCLAMALVADPLVRLLFQPRWYPLIPLLQIMSVGMALRTVSLPCASLLQAQGRFRTRMVLAIVSVVIFFPATILGTWLGSAIGLSIAVAIFYTLVALLDLATALAIEDGVAQKIRRVLGSAIGINLLTFPLAWLVSRAVFRDTESATPLLLGAEITASLTGSAVLYAVLVRSLAADVWRDAAEQASRMLPTRRRVSGNAAP